jgi:hypothetical protein
MQTRLWQCLEETEFGGNSASAAVKTFFYFIQNHKSCISTRFVKIMLQ